MDARERGVKFIVVDPRVTPLASIADIHLQLRPGTDGALALAMANVIISEGLYDREFVARVDPGLRRVPRATRPSSRWSGPRRSPACRRRKIREAALLYATTKPAAMMPSSSPVVHHVNGVQNQRATLALVGLTGNFDVPGGNVAAAPSWLHVSGAGFTTREHEFEMPRPWSDLPPRLGADPLPGVDRDDRRVPGHGLPAPGDHRRSLSPARPGGLRPELPPVARFGRACWPRIDKLDFVVDVDLFLTDSAKYADIVLPACSSVERSELRCYPQKYVIYTDAGHRAAGRVPLRHRHHLRAGRQAGARLPGAGRRSRAAAATCPTAPRTSAEPSTRRSTGSSSRAA